MSKFLMLIAFSLLGGPLIAGCGLELCTFEKKDEDSLQFQTFFQYRFVSIDREGRDGNFHEFGGRLGLTKGVFQAQVKFVAVNLKYEDMRRDGFLNPVLDLGVLLGNQNSVFVKLGVQYEMPLGDSVLTEDHHELLTYLGALKQFEQFSFEAILGYRFGVGSDDSGFDDSGVLVSPKKLHEGSHVTSDGSINGSSLVTPHAANELLFKVQSLYYFNAKKNALGLFVNSENPMDDLQIKDSENSIGALFRFHLNKTKMGLEFSKSVLKNDRFEYAVALNYSYIF